MNVTVVGCGAAGVEVVKTLREFDVTVVEPRNRVVCQAMLPELLSGKVEVDDVTFGLKEFLESYGAEWIRDSAVDVKGKAVYTERGRVIKGDFVILAVGSTVNHYNVKGAENLYNVNSLESALEAKKAVDRAGSVVVIGAGPTGVEVSLELREIGCEVTLLEMANRVLPSFSQKVSLLVYKVLNKEGVNVKVGERVLEVGRDGVLTDKGFAEGDLSIWCAGMKAPDIVDRLNVPKFLGWVAVDEYLSCGDIFAIGDCAHVRIGDEVATKTVLEARRQARHVADNIKRALRGGGLRAYRIMSSVKRPIAMITLGRGRAVMVYRGRLIRIPMSLAYRIKKIAVNRFVQMGKNSK